MYGVLFCVGRRFAGGKEKPFDPHHPEQEQHQVEKWAKYVIVEEIKGRIAVHENHGEADDTNNIHPVGDQESGGNKPGLVFPGARKQQHQHQEVREPFDRRAALIHDEPSAALEHHRKILPHDVVADHMLHHPGAVHEQHPAEIQIQRFQSADHQLLIHQRRVQEMEAEQDQQEDPDVAEGGKAVAVGKAGYPAGQTSKAHW